MVLMFRQTMLAAARIPLVHCMRQMVLFSKSVSENCAAAQPLPLHLQSAPFPPLTKLHLKYPEIQSKSWKVWRSTPNISKLFQIRWLCRTRYTTTVCPFFPGFSLRQGFSTVFEPFFGLFRVFPQSCVGVVGVVGVSLIRPWVGGIARFSGSIESRSSH